MNSILPKIKGNVVNEQAVSNELFRLIDRLSNDTILTKEEFQ